MCHNVPIQPPTEGCLGCFHILAITNKAAYKHWCAFYLQASVSTHWSKNQGTQLLDCIIMCLAL